MFGFNKKPALNENLMLVLDVDGVLVPDFVRFDPQLVSAAALYKENAVDILICSTAYNVLMHERLKNDGLDLDYEASRLYIGSSSMKAEKDFWKEAVKKGLVSSKAVYADNESANCKAARSAGIHALEWSSKDPERFLKLHAALTAQGYKGPSL